MAHRVVDERDVLAALVTLIVSEGDAALAAAEDRGAAWLYSGPCAYRVSRTVSELLADAHDIAQRITPEVRRSGTYEYWPDSAVADWLWMQRGVI